MASWLAIVPIAAFSLGLLTSLATFYFWLSQSVRKRYAAEREFEHIKAGQAAIQQMLTMLSDDIEQLKTEFVRYSSKD